MVLSFLILLNSLIAIIATRSESCLLTNTHRCTPYLSTFAYGERLVSHLLYLILRLFISLCMDLTGFNFIPFIGNDIVPVSPINTIGKHNHVLQLLISGMQYALMVSIAHQNFICTLSCRLFCMQGIPLLQSCLHMDGRFYSDFNMGRSS